LLGNDISINFFGGSEFEPSKKKMSDSQKKHLHALIGYKPPRLVTGKSCWYISFYSFDPVLDKLREKRIKLNHIKPIGNRRIYANELIKRINARLIDNWSPWVESENSNAYKLFSDVCEAYRAFLARQLNSDLIRPDSHRAYISYLRIIEMYNAEKGNIKYIYQFDQSFLSRFLDYIYIDRENTARTRNNYLGFLRLFSGYLIEHQYIKTKPTEAISRIGRRNLEKKKRSVIPDSVMQKIGNYFQEKNIHMYLACRILYGCMVRPSEMSRLKIENINLEKSTILVQKKFSKNRKTESPTIPDDLKELFLELKIKEYPGNYYLFSDDCMPGKEYKHSKQFRDHWDKMKKVLELPKEYQFYSFKHTGITDLIKCGVDLISVRDQARHYDISITNEYIPEGSQEANEKIKSNTKKF
jgi:integrase